MAKRGTTALALGPHLKQLRIRLGVTQVDLARALGIGQPSLSHIEARGDVETKTRSGLRGGSWWKACHRRRLLADRTNAVLRSQTLTINGDEDGHQPLLPGFGEVPTTARDVVLSIKPKYVTQILAGTKTVEMRRRFAVDPGVWALIYSTTPDRVLAGIARIADVQKLAISTLWRKHREAAGITKHDFDQYFSGVETGYAISTGLSKTRFQVRSH